MSPIHYDGWATMYVVGVTSFVYAKVNFFWFLWVFAIY